jgi:hypothetical protein
MGQSHATCKSIVPEGIQKVVPEAFERALTDSVSHPHRTSLFSPDYRLGSTTPASVASTHSRRKSRSTLRETYVTYPFTVALYVIEMKLYILLETEVGVLSRWYYRRVASLEGDTREIRGWGIQVEQETEGMGSETEDLEL